MARIIHRLAALKVAKIAKPGMHPDGNGLYLQITKGGAKSWIFRFRANGRRHDMGLGSCLDVSLAEARDKAEAARKECRDGKNPLAARRQKRTKVVPVVAFREAGEKYIEAHKEGWKNEKHRGQWSQTLESFAFPVIGDLPVSAIETDHILQILKPLWLAKTETASRLRGRLEKVLDWAKVSGFRDGENPARWKGHLDKLLPKKSKVKNKKHFPALPFAGLPAFMALLRQKEGISAITLRFQILNANRSGEVLGARWQEFDLDAALWTIPAERMKTGEEHRVPLSSAAIDILKAMQAVAEGEYVFPGRRGKILSDTALGQIIKHMHAKELKEGRQGFLDPKYNEVAVPHGFRSTFKDWCMETAPVEGEVDVLSEFALAHKLKNQVRASYFRSDLLDLRRPLMEAWANHALSGM